MEVTYYMKKNSKHWIIVKNKLTYLLLLTVPVGLLKIFLYDINLDNYMNVLEQIFLSIIIVLIGVYLFIRFNSYSHWFNPDHPKPRDEV